VLVSNRGRTRRRRRASFPTDACFHLPGIGIQAIQPSPYHTGPTTRRLQRLSTAAAFWHALVPVTFRIKVSQRTQEPPSEFLPAQPGIRPSASWRTTSAPRPRSRPRGTGTRQTPTPVATTDEGRSKTSQNKPALITPPPNATEPLEPQPRHGDRQAARQMRATPKLQVAAASESVPPVTSTQPGRAEAVRPFKK
jgi:hypothetical protein